MRALLQRLHQHASEHPPAVAYDQACAAPLTYQQLAVAVNTVARKLQLQLPVGATVLLCARNAATFPVAFLAVLAGGCTLLPCSADTTAVELRSLAALVGAGAIIGESAALAAFEGSDLLRIPIDRLPLQGSGMVAPAGEGTLLLQSSGSTGKPKIVVRSGASLDCAARAMAEAVGFTPADRVLMSIPLTHSYGLEHGILSPLWAGSSVTLTRGLDVAAVSTALGAGRVTILPGVPSTFEMLATLAEPAATASLRLAYSAGAALPLSVFESFRSRFDVPVLQLYGASEVGSVTFNAPRDGERLDPASVGRAMGGVSVRILDETDTPVPAGVAGRVAVRAGSMFDRYLHGETAGFVEGHFLTGDLGHLDERGLLFITGRSKLLIDVGGLKVNPEEVEAVLRGHPAVGACVVVPLAQSGTVWRLKAIVSPREPEHPVPLSELREWARRHLAGHKMPRQFEVRPALPLSATGKVLRHLVDAS